MPGWLKLLSLLALVLVGAPTVASAHGGHEDEPTTGWVYVAQNPNVDQSVAAGPSEHSRFFETSNRIPGGCVPRLVLLLSGNGALRSVRLLALCPRRSMPPRHSTHEESLRVS